MTVSDFEAMSRTARPMERLLDRDPRDRAMSPRQDRSLPTVMPGTSRTAAPDRTSPSERSETDRIQPARKERAQDPVEPQDFGVGNLNTIYHYNDYLVDPRSVLRRYPWRAAGKFYFTAADGNTYYCSAAPIAYGLLVTAGHCVHEGGTKEAGWIRSGYFAPGYNPKHAPYGLRGYCEVEAVTTTSGWYNQGALDKGYDVGLVACGKRITRTGKQTRRWIGQVAGTFSFCISNCRQDYWFMTQLGYPSNYYSGESMTVGQHLESTTSNSDYVYGSGMRGGSSGGPHVSNIDSIVDSASSGQWPTRNVIMAVTSWGYIDDTIKIQGASPLSGIDNANNFTDMYNSICRWARRNIGMRACSTL